MGKKKRNIPLLTETKKKSGSFFSSALLVLEKFFGYSNTGIYNRQLLKNSSFRNYLRYGLAVFFVAVALLIRLQLSEHLKGSAPSIPFVPAILLAAWYGGLGPGILATILSVIAS